MYGSGIYCSRSCAASHSTKGPRSKDVLESFRTKTKLRLDKRYGPFKEYQKKCHLCSLGFSVTERELKHPEKEKYFCSRACANNRGKMSKETKKKIRESLFATITVNPGTNKVCTVCCEEFYATFSERNIRRCRSCIDNKKRNQRKSSSSHVVTKKCDECGSLCPNNDRKYCSSTCLGLSRRLKRDPKVYSDYKALCKFRFHLGDFPDEFDFDLLKEHGMYKVKQGDKNNTSGISRDHMVSVSFGFKNNIDSALISHPANCRLMLHSENSKKHIKCDISIEQLKERIAKWDEKYPSI